jgi:hypothetical protein
MYVKIVTINSSSIAQTLARKIVCPEFHDAISSHFRQITSSCTV